MTTAFAMGTATCQETIACSGCGCWLLRNTDLLPAEEMACAVALTDSSSTLCVKQANVVVGPAEPYDRQSADTWEFVKADVSCPSCQAFLGIKLLTATALHEPDPFGTHLADFEGRAGCYIKPPADAWLTRAATTAAAVVPFPPVSELCSPGWSRADDDEFETASEGGSSQWTVSSEEASSSEGSLTSESSGDYLTDDEDIPMVRVRRRAHSDEEPTMMRLDMDDDGEEAGMGTADSNHDADDASGVVAGSGDHGGGRVTQRRQSTGCVGQGLRQVGCALRTRVRRSARRRHRAAAATVATEDHSGGGVRHTGDR